MILNVVFLMDLATLKNSFLIDTCMGVGEIMEQSYPISIGIIIVPKQYIAL